MLTVARSHIPHAIRLIHSKACLASSPTAEPMQHLVCQLKPNGVLTLT